MLRYSVVRLFSQQSFKPPVKVSTWNRLMKSGVNKTKKPEPGDFIPITWRSLAVTFGIGALGLWYLNKEKKEMEERLAKQEAERQNRTYGKVAVGGPFNLTDCDTGLPVTEKSFLGKFMIIYFGFTNCPDVCPDELEKMSKAINRIDLVPGIKEQVTPVFISVDPKRDTPEIVKKYIKEFHPRFVGLTGSQEQVEAAAKAYRIYISKGDPINDNDQDYLVDHSIFFFLMDPEGNFMDFFGRNSTDQEISDKIIFKVKEWQKHKSSGRL